jgi:hypothetical protein
MTAGGRGGGPDGSPPRRTRRVNINVAGKTNIKVARNIAKGNSTAVASARQEAEIRQGDVRNRD